MPGHYETPCGGCDTIKRQPDIQEIVRKKYGQGFDVLYEGLLASEESHRTIEMIRDGLPLIILLLTTNVEMCIERINARRKAKNPDAKPVNEKNTRNRVRVIDRACKKIAVAGGRVIPVSPEDALCLIERELSLPLNV